MIPLPQVSGKRYGVIWLGKSGRAAIAAMRAGGAEVLAWDDKVEAMPEGAIRHYFRSGAWPPMEGLVWSPGIPFLHPIPNPVAVRARAEGCPLVCDVDLLAHSDTEAALVGITGTNGK